MELNPRSTKVNIELVVWMTIVVFALCIVCILLRVKLESFLDQYEARQVLQKSTLVAELANEKFRVRLNALEGMARHIERHSDLGGGIVGLDLDIKNYNYGLLSLGDGYFEGDSLTGVTMDEFGCLAEALHGAKTFCYRQGKGLLFAVPVYHNRNIRNILYKLYREKGVDDFFDDNCISERCYMVVLDSSDYPVIESKRGNWKNDSGWRELDYTRIYERLNLRDRWTGAMVVSENVGGELYYFYRAKLGYRGFSLVGMEPKSKVGAGLNRIPFLVFCVVGMLVVLFVLGIFACFFIDRKRRERHRQRKEADPVDDPYQERLSLLRNAGTEMRAPLSSILAMNSVIAKENHDPALKDYTRNISGAGQWLLSLADDLEDIAKVDLNSLEITSTEYDLFAVLSGCLTAADSVNKTKNFELKVNSRIPSRLIGDEIRVRQILGNIFFNAERFSSGAVADIFVDYERVAEDGEWDGRNINLIIKVPDSGSGWTGIGLTLVRRLVLLMRGELKLNALLDDKPAFMIVLPQQVVRNEPVGDFKRRYDELQLSSRNSTRYFCAPTASVLAVDSMLMNLRVMGGMLKETEIHMDAVDNGMEALEKFKRKHYDIVFLDHAMPVIDGMDLFTMMSGLADHPNKDTPIVMLTANSEMIAREVCEKIGYADFLTEPVREESLFAMLLKFLPKDMVQWFDVVPEEEVRNEELQEDTPVAPPRKRQEVLATATPETPMLPDDLENLMTTGLVDVLIGLECCQMNEAIYRKRLMDFSSDHADVILNSYFKAEDFESYRLLVRSLKSKALYIGAVEISSISKTLEFACNEGDYDFVRNRHGELMQKYRQLMQIFKELF